MKHRPTRRMRHKLVTEPQHIEWKEAWRDDHLRWVGGFANAEVVLLHPAIRRRPNRQLDACLTGKWTLDGPRILAVPLAKLWQM
jgi:hypothetical protein